MVEMREQAKRPHAQRWEQRYQYVRRAPAPVPRHRYRVCTCWSHAHWTVIVMSIAIVTATSTCVVAWIGGVSPSVSEGATANASVTATVMKRKRAIDEIASTGGEMSAAATANERESATVSGTETGSATNHCRIPNQTTTMSRTMYRVAAFSSPSFATCSCATSSPPSCDPFSSPSSPICSSCRVPAPWPCDSPSACDRARHRAPVDTSLPPPHRRQHRRARGSPPHASI